MRWLAWPHFTLLGQASSPTEPWHYRPFLTPLPVWGNHAWPWLLLPLTVAVAIVYKSIKCSRMNQVPREASVLSIWIIGGMMVAAGVLAVIVEILERLHS